jgi:hypothetical protein
MVGYDRYGTCARWNHVSPLRTTPTGTRAPDAGRLQLHEMVTGGSDLWIAQRFEARLACRRRGASGRRVMPVRNFRFVDVTARGLGLDAEGHLVSQALVRPPG